jgi:hypothetical protein
MLRFAAVGWIEVAKELVELQNLSTRISSNLCCIERMRAGMVALTDMP